MNAALQGGIRALFIMGENPLLSDPNLNHVAEAVASLEFLVVQDIFLNETAREADVVLPGVSFAEKEGTYTNTERRVQRVRAAMPPRTGARRDLDIICALGTRLGGSNGDHPPVGPRPTSDWNYPDAAAVWNEIADLTPSLAGISYARLDGDGLQWPCPAPDHPGTPILHREKFTRGLGRFAAVGFREPVENPDGDYPFVLNTGRILQHWHGGTLSRRSVGLNALVPRGEIEINARDAAELKIANGDPVRVESRRGAVTGAARLSDRLPRGMLFMNFHFAEMPTNALTGDALDPVAKIPEYKVSAVRIQRV